MNTLAELDQNTVKETLETLVTPQTDTGYGACKLSREQVREAWGMGVLNDAAYVWLAFQFMRKDDAKFTLDVGEFCDIWIYEIGEGKEKRIKPESVRKILATWEAKGLIAIPQEPIQMQLFF